MQPPPPRYKVVERGRRLEVIDTRGEWRPTEPPAPPPPPPPPPPRARGSVEPPRTALSTTSPSSGPFARRSFTTHAWFDDHGPRTITLDAAGEAQIDKLLPLAALGLAVLGVAAFFLWPISLALVFALAGKASRGKLRAAATRQLDRLDPAVADRTPHP